MFWWAFTGCFIPFRQSNLKSLFHPGRRKDSIALDLMCELLFHLNPHLSIKFSTKLLIPLNATVIQPYGFFFIRLIVREIISHFQKPIKSLKICRIHPFNTINQRRFDNLKIICIHRIDFLYPRNIVFNSSPSLSNNGCNEIGIMIIDSRNNKWKIVHIFTQVLSCNMKPISMLDKKISDILLIEISLIAFFIALCVKSFLLNRID